MIKYIFEKYVCRTRKSDSPSRLREGPATRLGGNLGEKDIKPKVERVEADEDSSQESEKAENNSENEDVIILNSHFYF